MSSVCVELISLLVVVVVTTKLPPRFIYFIFFFEKYLFYIFIVKEMNKCNVWHKKFIVPLPGNSD